MKHRSLALALALGLTPLAAHGATPKAGTKCSKAGAITKVKSTTLVCTKKGKSLTWAIRQPVATANPTTAQLALNRLTIPAASASSPVTFVYEFGAHADADFAKVLMGGGTAALRFWATTLTYDKPIPIIYGSVKDSEFVLDAVARYGHSSLLYVQNVRKRLAEEGDFANLAGVSTAPDNTVVMQFIRGPLKSAGYLDRMMIPHEYTHLVQAQFTGFDNNRLPCWALEGGAQFFAHAIGVKLMGQNELQGRLEGLRITSSSDTFDEWKATPAMWLEAIINMEQPNSRSCWDDRLGYSAGMLMSELLVAEHGQQAVLAWWKASASQDWRSAFHLTFGTSVDTWYSQSAIPYLIAQYRLIPKNR